MHSLLGSVLATVMLGATLSPVPDPDPRPTAPPSVAPRDQHLIVSGPTHVYNRAYASVRTTVVAFLAATLVLVYRAHRLGAWGRLATPLTVLVWAIVVQGAIGYAQYFSGVPAFLVALHVLGAVLVWVAVVQLGFATREPTGQPTDAPSEASAPSLAATS